MKRRYFVIVPLALLVVVYFLKGPYLFSTSVALGPCLKDWTSPSTYQPRSSPMKTLDFEVEGVSARLCYGAPSSRDRALFGDEGLVPNRRLWRMGANEPTRLFVTDRITLGEVALEPGRYSLYAQPDSSAWTVYVTGSTWHWGNMITRDVRAQEVGSFEAYPLEVSAFDETLTFRHSPGFLSLGWGTLRLPMPVGR